MAAVRVYNPQKKPVVQTVTNGPSRVANAQAEAERLDHMDQLNELQRENEILQDQLDKIADLAAAPKDEESETLDDLKDKLNRIIDVAAPGEEDDSEDDEGEDED